jgi:drug/metabolite transporter (DMT)-like permease
MRRGKAGKADPVSTAVGVAAAVGAALVFGVTSVAEQRSTKRVKKERTGSPLILLDLVRQPLWDIAIVGTVIGFALQVVGLKYAPLAVVEPILVFDLIFAVLISAYLRRSADPFMLAGVVACAAGVAGFLVIARPTAGVGTVSLAEAIWLAIGAIAAVAGCLVVGQSSETLRPLGMALATGICYGLSAFLIKLVTSEASHGGFVHVLTSWPIYGLAIAGPIGFILNQDAFQSGTFIAPVMAIITAADPLISIALAAVLLNEQLSSSPAAIAGEVTCLVLMTAGIIVIARHSPQAVKHAAAKAAATPQAVPPRSGLENSGLELDPEV